MSAGRRIGPVRSASSKWPRRLPALVCAAAATSLLQGCFPVLVAGIVGTAVVATDRRSPGTQADDGTISVKVEGRIGERLGDKAHVGAMTYSRRVLLTGEVPTQTAKDEAGKIAASVENVAGVANELTVGPPSSLSSRSNDALISTKVKASLVDAKDVFANSCRVTTQQGTVYLMGRVTPREGDRAAEIARGVSGVVKVVKIFDYVSENDLKRM